LISKAACCDAALTRASGGCFGIRRSSQMMRRLVAIGRAVVMGACSLLLLDYSGRQRHFVEPVWT
jgi:hypothetical protein